MSASTTPGPVVPCDRDRQRSSLRRRVLLAGGALVVLAVVTLGALLLSRHGKAGHAQPIAISSSSDAPSHPTAPRFGAARARALSTALTSGDETAIKSVFDMSSGQPIDPAAVSGLHALGHIDFDLSSFRDRGDGTAIIDATTPATATEPAQSWYVLLVASSQHQWLISQTDAK